MTIRITVLLAALLLIAWSAQAQLMLNSQMNIGGAGGGGGGCTNKLDFSVACNSQYISLVFP